MADIKMNKIIYISMILCLVNIPNALAMSVYGDEDGDGVINAGDECPFFAADYNTHDGPYLANMYGYGCPSYCPHGNCKINPPEPVYQGPEWILKIINWHNSKIINDITYSNAINYLLQKHIITIK